MPRLACDDVQHPPLESRVYLLSVRKVRGGGGGGGGGRGSVEKIVV